MDQERQRESATSGGSFAGAASSAAPGKRMPIASSKIAAGEKRLAGAPAKLVAAAAASTDGGAMPFAVFLQICEAHGVTNLIKARAG